jgi:hypothetical protein
MITGIIKKGKALYSNSLLSHMYLNEFRPFLAQEFAD